MNVLLERDTKANRLNEGKAIFKEITAELF